MLPLSARVRRDGQSRVIDASQLYAGYPVVLRPGERISADLELTVSRSLAVDESMIILACRPPCGRSMLLLRLAVRHGH
jgi:Ca2+-transporting ATPase